MSYEAEAMAWGWELVSKICPSLPKSDFDKVLQSSAKGIEEVEFRAARSQFEKLLTAYATVLESLVQARGGYQPGMFSRSLADDESSGPSAIEVVNSWRIESTPYCPSN